MLKYTFQKFRKLRFVPAPMNLPNTRPSSFHCRVAVTNMFRYLERFPRIGLIEVQSAVDLVLVHAAVEKAEVGVPEGRADVIVVAVDSQVLA